MGANSTQRYRAGTPNVELWKLRINAGLSANDLGTRAGTTGKTIREVERGHVPNPRLQRTIAAVFDLEPLDLFPFENQPGVGS